MRERAGHGVLPGYKQTELGLLPDAWTVKPLSTISEKIMVGIASAATHAYRTKGVPLLRNQNIKNGYLDDSDVLYVDPIYEETFRNKRLQAGDLLTARTGYPGVTCVVLPEYEKAQSFTTLITRPKRREIESAFLCHFINSERGQWFFEKSQIGGAQKNVNAGTLRGMPVPVPAPSEQRAIAAALSDVDALIGALDRLIAKKRDLKQAVLQQLLTGQTRLPGFRRKWESRCLGTVATFRTGPFGSALHKSDYTSDGIPVVNPMHIIDGRIVPTSTMTVTEGAAAKLGEFRLKVGDVVLGRRGEMGRCSVVGDEEAGWLCGTGSMIVRSSTNLLPAFLQRLLSSAPIISAIEDGSVGTTMININQRAIARLEVELPQIDEQLAIAAVLSDMDAEIAALEQRRDKTRLLKQGMMQELLTGRIRLV